MYVYRISKLRTGTDLNDMMDFELKYFTVFWTNTTHDAKLISLDIELIVLPQKPDTSLFHVCKTIATNIM